MNERNSPQQKPASDPANPQQAAGSNASRPDQPEQQGGSGQPQQMGEGSYEGARDYKERTENYVKNADVEADAQAAKPRSEQEAREMKQAEEEGRSHSKGEH